MPMHMGEGQRERKRGDLKQFLHIVELNLGFDLMTVKS